MKRHSSQKKFSFESDLGSLPKQVWSDMARSLTQQDDQVMVKNGPEILRWLQDMNWPGADIVRERYLRMSKQDIEPLIMDLLALADQIRDEDWAENLRDLLSR